MARKKLTEEINETMESAIESLLEGSDFIVSTYSNTLTNNRRIPTPIEVLNCVFGGGVPLGMIVNSYGRSKTGKSTWLYQMMALFQMVYPEGICFIVDSETSGDATRAKHFGVLTDKVIVTCPSSIEQGFLSIQKMLENKKKNPRLKNVPVYGIWDSISNGLASDGSTQSRMNAQDRARIIKNYLGPLMVDMEKEEFFLGLVNQAVRKTDNYGNSKDVSGGGYALEHDAHLQAQFKSYNGDVFEGKFLVRRTSLLTVDKSKISPEIKDIPIIMDITEGGMIDSVASFVEYMMDLGYLVSSQGWYKLTDLANSYRLDPLYYIFNYYDKSYRYDEIHKKMKDTPLLYNALRYMFMSKYSSIYKLQSQIMKPYMDECLKQIREEYDSPEYYMNDNPEKAKPIIDKLSSDEELKNKVRESANLGYAVCLKCGQDHEVLYKCDCDGDIGCVVTASTALKILDSIENPEVPSENKVDKESEVESDV